jgi:arabinogalactan oligomer/maltooligosaccharide transport system substrate-binding protein
LSFPLLSLVSCSPEVSESTATRFTTEASVSQISTPEKPDEEGITEALEAKGTATEKPDSRLTGQVSIWHSLDENEIKSLDSVIEIFREMNPDVEFDVLYVPAYDIQGKYETSAQIGGGACILIGSDVWGPQLYDSLLITDLSQFVDDVLLATINPAALGLVQYSDAIIGLPMNLSGIIPLRNKRILPGPASTFDELLSLAQEATSGDVVGAYLDYGLFYSAAHLEGIGGQLMDKQGNPTFNDEKGVEWVELIQRFEDAGPIENNNDNDINLFSQGKAGFIIIGLWNVADLEDAIGSDNLAVDPWPSPMSGYIQSDNLYLNANSTGDELETCWSFMEFMLSPESQLLFSDPDMASYIPSISGVNMTDPLQNQVMETFIDGTAFPILPEMSVYWDPLNNALLSVLEQGVDPEEALEIAEDQVLANLEDMRE